MSALSAPPDESIPEGWDRLLDPPSRHEAELRSPATRPPSHTPASRGALALASWAELAVLAAPCAATLAGVRLAGYQVGFACVPWAGVLALSWWFLATLALLLVRRATAGMLSAGLRFDGAIPPRRLAMTAAAALAAACLAGIPAVLGARWWLPAVAAGSPAEQLTSSAA